MKRASILLSIFVFVLAISFVFAADCTSFNYSNWSSCTNGIQTRTVLNSSPLNCTGGSPTLNQSCVSSNVITTTTSVNLSSIDKGFACLEANVKDDCSGATNIQEIALIILASPKTSVSQGCYNKLKTYDKGNCFGSSSCSVFETALGVLAYNQLRLDTTKYRAWLTNQTMISTDIQWFMQQDSNDAANCKVTYDSADYPFSVQTNKKIDVNAGSCLSLANSNYWYSIDANCYDKSFAVVCDKAFIANLIYKQPNSPIVYVLSNTQSAPASGSINLQVKSKCFGQGFCDYESTAWAVLALKNSGINVDEFIPYLVASSDVNKQYLPYAFLNMFVDYSEYGTKLVQMQTLNSWEAENSAYNQYYDTALALLSLSDSSATQVKSAKDWLTGYAQASSGCWNNNNTRDTAMILWALQKRQPTYLPTGITLTTCSEGNFFCVNDCPSDQIKQNYVGCSAPKSCCGTQNLKTCDQLYGQICPSGKVCDGDVRQSSDSSSCCLSSCVDPQPQVSACEQGGNSCRNSCTSNQEEVALSCDGSSQVCCKTKTTSSEGPSLWGVWVLLVILIILIVLGIIYREQIKVWLYKRKSGFRKDGEMDNSNRPSGPGAGLPPQQRVNRPMMSPVFQQGMQRRPLPQQSPGRVPPRI
jgi:hypothetical protein